MFVQAWTTREIEALEAIALPRREAFTGLCSGLITVDADVAVDVDADADIDLDNDCGDSGVGCS